MKNTDFGITNAACSILLKRTCPLIAHVIGDFSALQPRICGLGPIHEILNPKSSLIPKPQPQACLRITSETAADEAWGPAVEARSMLRYPINL